MQLQIDIFMQKFGQTLFEIFQRASRLAGTRRASRSGVALGDSPALTTPEVNRFYSLLHKKTGFRPSARGLSVWFLNSNQLIQGD